MPMPEQTTATWSRPFRPEATTAPPVSHASDARAYAAKAATLRQLGQAGRALDLFDRTVSLREALLADDRREDALIDLARDRASRDDLLDRLGGTT